MIETNTSSSQKESEEETNPKTFSYQGFIPKSKFGIKTNKQFYEKDGQPFMG